MVFCDTLMSIFLPCKPQGKSLKTLLDYCSLFVINVYTRTMHEQSYIEFNIF